MQLESSDGVEQLDETSALNLICESPTMTSVKERKKASLWTAVNPGIRTSKRIVVYPVES